MKSRERLAYDVMYTSASRDNLLLDVTDSVKMAALTEVFFLLSYVDFWHMRLQISWKKLLWVIFFLFHSIWKVPWYFFAWDPIHSWKWPFCCLGATRQIKCSPSTWATVPLKTDLLCSETPWWETIPLSRALFFLQKPSFSSICKQRVSCWVLSPTSHSYSPTSY